MKITVLCDNNTRIDNYLLAEPALSLLVEHKDKKILFDTGYSDVFIRNSEKMKISLSDITDIVISHGHDDHTGGLSYFDLKNISLIAHPNIFDKKIDKNGVEYGCPVSFEELSKSYGLRLTKEPYWLNDEFVFLGEIPDNKSGDIDDSALVYKDETGIFIITGCSHGGIVNIIEYAKSVCSETMVNGVFGGFHLLGKSQTELIQAAENMQACGVSHLYPCHCSDLNSKIILSKFFNVYEVCTGDIFDL